MSGRSRLRGGSTVLVAMAVLAGCGAPSGQMSAAASGTRSADAANVAQQAADPRTADPTAAPAAQPRLAPPAARSAAPPSTELIPGSPAEPSAGEAPSKIGARHILVMWMGSERAPASIVRSRTQARAVAEEVHRRAHAGEDFARLAVEFSDEPGAGARGGSLGKFGRGQMVPAFEAAAFELDVLQISDVVETPFGFHVIQRTE